jgi:HEAT repeat protein
MLDDDRRIDALIRDLTNRGEGGLRASTALAEIGPPAVEPLVRALQVLEDEYARKLAALSLGRIGKPAVQPLIDSLRVADPQVRMLALQALSAVRDDMRVQRALLEARKDPNAMVRQAAWQGLERLPPRQISPYDRATRRRRPEPLQ